MKLTRGTRAGVWFAAALLIAAVSYFVGGQLRPAQEPHYLFDTQAAAYGEPAPLVATSPGGFTGFGETDGSRSRVVISGRVSQFADDALTLEGIDGQLTSLRFGETPPIFRLEDGDAALLTTGARVAVRLNEAGDTVLAVLVLSQP